MFRNNRNKQKTNRNSSKFVKKSTFLIPHTISSVSFDTGPKHRNKPKNIFLGFAKKQTEKQPPKQIEFRFVSVRTEKKNYGFEDPWIENVFWRFFRFVLRKFCLFRLFQYWSETPKKSFLIFVNKPKNNRNRLSFGLFRFEPKTFFDCFEDTLVGENADLRLVLKERLLMYVGILISQQIIRYI